MWASMMSGEVEDGSPRLNYVQKELNRRERYDYQNRRYIKGFEVNPILVLPDENLKTLDMFPRVNLIEDLQFRKQLPNSFKMYHLN